MVNKYVSDWALTLCMQQMKVRWKKERKNFSHAITIQLFEKLKFLFIKKKTSKDKIAIIFHFQKSTSIRLNQCLWTDEWLQKKWGVFTYFVASFTVLTQLWNEVSICPDLNCSTIEIENGSWGNCDFCTRNKVTLLLLIISWVYCNDLSDFHFIFVVNRKRLQIKSNKNKSRLSFSRAWIVQNCWKQLFDCKNCMSVFSTYYHYEYFFYLHLYPI